MGLNRLGARDIGEKIVPQHLVFSFEPTVGLDQIWTFFFVIAHLQFQGRV